MIGVGIEIVPATISSVTRSISATTEGGTFGLNEPSPTPPFRREYTDVPPVSSVPPTNRSIVSKTASVARKNHGGKIGDLLMQWQNKK